MSDDLINKQQKCRRKLTKYQQKISYYIQLSDSEISLKKRAAKLAKYRLKVIKRQLKLKRLDAQITLSSAYTKLTPANDAIVSMPIFTQRSVNPSSLAQVNLYRPHKSKPCKSCPALRGKACLCAMKSEQRKQA
ncbi:hypothetical protein L2719_06260 [Shewanella schlegeliana]|uniref:Uncharacterized protein n=1 Tax=Shewanella schlegeliana TaxID=190308 RepID=A0ABS1SXE7_9GAMM|nr:hypothetical protein [Shewanella schlegeliana]MBL4913192.1 hypothetical protein [Shewanella schlegeliana]MCL1109148.1 hypothetical protein [Shewanella schlegeliana]GIU24090.1 hypothetical protein TUM4433_07340 [Shewanella schlegeliana]